MIRPAGPLPETLCRSIPACLALCRTAGLARGFPLAPVLACLLTGVAGAGAGVGAGAGLDAALTGSGVASGSGVVPVEFPSPSTSNTMHTWPTGMISPGAPVVDAVSYTHLRAHET